MTVYCAGFTPRFGKDTDDSRRDPANLTKRNLQYLVYEL
jgi:hypothetical protein